MFWTEPEEVSLLGHALGGVESIEVNRRAASLAIEWGDGGPHAVFADVPEQRVDVRIVRRLEGGDGAFEASIVPGAAGELSFRAGRAGSDADRVRVSMSIVVTAVEHGLHAGGCAQQRVLCVAVSADGATDPVTVTKEAP